MAATKPSTVPRWATVGGSQIVVPPENTGAIPVWAPGVYTAGSPVIRGGNQYIVLAVSGTGTSTTGPVGTGGTIDNPGANQVQWAFVTTTPVTKDSGWIAGVQPPAQYFNWFWNLVYLWILYLQDLEAEPMAWTNVHSFSTGSGTGVTINGNDDTLPCLTVENEGDGPAATFIANGPSVGLFAQGGADNPGVLAQCSGGNGPGIQGVGSGTGAGLYGIGGATGPGVKGQGNGGAAGGQFMGGANGPGVWGIGGTGNAQGGLFAGSGGSQGVVCSGGPTSGIGLIALAGGGNADAIQGTGSGTGAGVRGTGGATGSGGVFSGGATSGTGVSGTGTGGFVGGAFQGASGASGVLAVGGANGAGIDARGGSTGNTVGVLAQGHGSGGGIAATGGASSGPGVQGFGGTGNANGVEGTGTGTGAGVKGTGGASGAGVQAIGNAAGITGPAILATQSHGESDVAIQVTKGTLRFTGTPALPDVDLGANALNGSNLVKSQGVLTVRFGSGGGAGSGSVFFSTNPGHNYFSAQIEVDRQTISIVFKTPMASDDFHVDISATWQQETSPPINTINLPIRVFGWVPAGTGFSFVLINMAGVVSDLDGAPGGSGGVGSSDYVFTWAATGRQ